MTIYCRMSQPSFTVPNIRSTPGKRMMNSDVEIFSSPHKKKKRTSEDFLEFCSMVLNYTQYNTESSEMLRAEYNTSPLDSTGTADSSDSYTSDISQISYNPHRDHNSSFEEEDSMDLVTCFCLKPYAGRPMIECSECNLWIHLSCAKIRKTNIPETFTCQKCRDAQLKTRKSSRTRVENKRVTL